MNGALLFNNSFRNALFYIKTELFSSIFLNITFWDWHAWNSSVKRIVPRRVLRSSPMVIPSRPGVIGEYVRSPEQQEVTPSGAI